MPKLLISLIMVTGLLSCDEPQVVKTTPVLKFVSPIRTVNTVKKGKVKRGQGLFQALKGVSIENKLALSLINTLRDEVEFSKLKVGDRLEATFNEDNDLVKFSFAQNLYETHVVNIDPKSKKWDYSLEVVETTWQPRVLEGELRSGSSLEQDLLAQGLPRSVVNEVVNVLTCKVNFRMYARHGDRYTVLLNERMYDEKVVQTQVLYTSYDGVRAGHHEAFYFKDKEKNSTYTAHYTENGQALINAGLRYPVSRLHIRSGYGWRRHPVTGKRAMHRGVDFRARTGTPVHAVASGKVVVSTYHKYAGNKVVLRHKDNSKSFYYHLSRRGVRVGQWVRTNQIIGNVGATGRVTGPHLHFGFKNSRGKWMNPLNKRMIATPKLKGERFANLTKQISEIKGVLADLKLSENSNYLIANMDFFGRRPSTVEDFSVFPEGN